MAILEDRKTQTRRIVKPLPAGACITMDDLAAKPEYYAACGYCPYGTKGDLLWVKETGWEPKQPSARELREGADTWPKYVYDATEPTSKAEAEQYKAWGWKRRPSIFMREVHSRILLQVVSVRVERLQDITAADAIAEGVILEETEGGKHEDDPISAYRRLWVSINGPGSWELNPWVWVIEFRRVSK